MANQEKQDLVRLLREEKGLLNEILNFLKQQESARSELTKSQTEANRIQKEFNSLIETANKATEDRVSDLNATAKIQKAITREENLQNQIKQKIKETTGAEQKAYKNLEIQTAGVSSNLKDQLKNAKELDKYGGFFKGLSNVVKKVPFLSALAEPFKDAAKAARESASEQLAQGKSVSRLKTSFASIKTLIGPGGGFLGIATILTKFFIEIDKTVVGTAKSLGISKANARDIADSFISISNTSSNLLVNARSLVEATGQLSENLGATAVQSEKTLKNQIFLTKNLGLSVENASNLSFLFDTFNGSSMGATNSVIELNKNLVKTNGFLIPTNKLLGEIAGTSAEIQGYFGFSAKELANAVYQTRRFGISLSSANSIAQSLLNFEESIRNELQLELLTNKSLNFERARALAFTGDIAGASAEVLRQTQNLTEEQRKNPIILKAAADNAGLSVEELNKAFIIQKRLNLSSKQYNDLIARGSALVGFERTQALAMQSTSREEFENTLTIQQKLQGATARITQAFEKLVNSKAIDRLIDGAVVFATALASGEGFFASFRAARANMRQAKMKQDELEVEDFTIRSSPKDTLVMAGGTKFGDETNALLRELITAVNAGGDVYMSGTKVGRHVFGNLTKQS